MSILDHALTLAKNGILIFPCNLDKTPKTKNGFKDATKEEKKIRIWWELWPNAAIGMPTGQVNGIVVLDVDVDKERGIDGEASLAALLAKESSTLPATRIVKTPRGGRHWHFDPLTTQIKNSTSKIGEGLDIRGDGGYVLLPPSTVSDGRSYTFENDEGVADLPEWLKKLLVEPARKTSPAKAHQYDDTPDRAKIEEALKYISPACHNQDWVEVGMALHSWDTNEGLSIWDSWSRQASESYDEGDPEKRWKSFKPSGGITIGTLFGKAKDAGWIPYKNAPLPSRPAPSALKPIPDKKEIIVLPGGATSITVAAEQIFKKIAPTHKLFTRGGIVMELRSDDKKGLRLDVMKSQSFRSRIEKMGTLFAWRAGRGGEAVLKSVVCPSDTAEALLACQASEELLPTVRGLASCPVIVEIDGQIQILGKGYHPANGGLLVTSGDKPPDMPLEEAIQTLKLLVEEFEFSTPNDRSRALASFITPALRIGGWLRGHIAVDMAEANASQSGKGYRQNLIFSVYNERPSLVTLKNGGVGGLDESISQALIYGRPFIQVDNIRGKLDSQFIEMMLTAGGMISARIPQKAEVLVDSRHFILMMTSNGVETTPDLANRSSIIRIRKREGYTFKTFPEGDLLDNVKANQPYFLSAVFAVIRAWHEAGKQHTTDTQHDFREWAQTLGWIVENILGEAPLMDGHRHAQERVSNPALTWLRRVALAVEADNRLDEDIMASDLAELCEGHSIEIPGLRDFSDETGRNKRVGILMRKAFGDTTEVQIDRCTIKRTEKNHYYQNTQENKILKAYIFTVEQPELPMVESEPNNELL